MSNKDNAIIIKVFVFLSIFLFANVINGQVLNKIKFEVDSLLKIRLGSRYCEDKLICLKSKSNGINWSFCCNDSILDKKKRNSFIEKYHFNTNSKYVFIYDLELDDTNIYPIILSFDSFGKWDKTKWDIPDCIDSLNCAINIDSLSARKIAEKNGFPKGVTEWQIKLKYNKMDWYFYWEIKSTSKIEDSERNGNKVRNTFGTLCSVRANDGKFLYRKSTWFNSQFNSKP